MPFCPKCHTEYVDGTARCEDCSVALVEKLPLADTKAHEDLVEVWHAQGELEGQMIRALLEGNGIDSMIQGESLRLTHGLTVDGLAEVHILVRDDDVKHASEIIAAMDGMTTCGNCGHPARIGDDVCYYCDAPISQRGNE